ncbi:protein mono-ADP-ribosyltransferase PARP16-like [Anopheles maculipalpis]|uniref:protein mono-ADP-ribosyltransferase PARP16-like n=1 Tax=Anopheles maculipalpis TaxID=1496333 RepID=UPI002159088E|nr:protein mono-ADP-ribosyltransferase PARP16-like [Anopheles maculipalpis]
MELPPLSIEAKRLLVLKTILHDPAAADLRLSLFVSAARSFRYDSCLQPFPPDFMQNNEKCIDQLCQVLDTVPSVADLPAGLHTLGEQTIGLLHWILCRQARPALRTVPKPQFDEVLSKCPCYAKYAVPNHIFEVLYRENNSSERAFQDHATEYRTRHAFHGSRLFNFHSILHYGLQQHLNKVSLFGEGIYLSAELQVSQMFSPNGSGWNKSILGTQLACIALCEYVDNPNYVKSQEDTPPSADDGRTPATGTNDGSSIMTASLTGNGSIPERYILVKNNELVQIRYLLLYGTTKDNNTTAVPGGPQSTADALYALPARPPPYQLRHPPSRFIQWIANNKGFVLIGGYVGLLLIVGFINSRNAHFVKEMFLQKLNHVYNAVLGYRGKE